MEQPTGNTPVSQGNCDVWRIRLDTVAAKDPTQLARCMPLRMEKARRYRFEKDRLRCMGAGFLLLEALKIPDEGALRYHEYGKPYAPGFPCFNLSHSGSWCVLAVSETEIGIDIEEIRGEYLQITRAVLTPEEMVWMRQDPLIRFHRLWTWKESVMKATGLGLNLDPKEIDVLPFTRGEPVRTASGQWYALDEQIDNCRLSICTLRPMKHIRRMELLADGQRAVPAPE